MELLGLIFYLVVVIGIISADSRLKKIEGHLRAMREAWGAGEQELKL